MYHIRKMWSGLNVQNALLVISRQETKMGNNYVQNAGAKADQYLVLKLNYSGNLWQAVGEIILEIFCKYNEINRKTILMDK